MTLKEVKNDLKKVSAIRKGSGFFEEFTAKVERMNNTSVYLVHPNGVMYKMAWKALHRQINRGGIIRVN